MASHHKQMSATLRDSAIHNKADAAALGLIITETLAQDGVEVSVNVIAIGFGGYRARLTVATDGDDAVAFCDSDGTCSAWNSPTLARMANDAIRDHRVRVNHARYLGHCSEQSARLAV